jgi:polysaccharide deacetylase family protein (PEP-CTERM system associated)
MVVHHFSVDVEEYFHPTALAPHYPMAEWDTLERRSPRVIPKILDLLAEHDVRGTFFTLGWLAEREPAMLRCISDAGHEIASHGYDHQLVGRLGPEGFRKSVRRTKAVLEDVSGQEVIGYRAPSFSILPGMEWAFDILLEEHYRYDASLFPIAHHPTYGYPGAEKDPYWIERPSGRLAEFPSTTAQVLGRTLPASGGAYFRLLPYELVRLGMKQAESRGASGMFYTHPWEMDGWAPDVAASRLQMWRTFAGRQGTWARMTRLFREFRFGRVLRATCEAMETRVVAAR